jgi:predicted ATP-grasp superfamily ATP-dependent carboligase
MTERDRTKDRTGPMVGLVGASARAAVVSLARAGFSACALDLFGDRDLIRIAETVVCPISDYPTAFPALARQLPPGPLLYTGGLENHPEIVAQLALARPLWGNGPSVLARVRDPFWLSANLPPGVGSPRLILAGELSPREGRWLRKPLRSSGGRGIRFAQPGEAASPHHHFQEWVPGEAYSAQYVTGAGAGSHTELLGVTEQLIGASWLHAPPFAYCGNIGIGSVAPEVFATLAAIGETLGEAAGLHGLWGLDFILDGDRVWVLEINPRYTAALEVLELAGGFASMSLHADCFADRSSTALSAAASANDQLVGKAIYYAPRRFIFPDSGPWDADLSTPFDPWRIPGYADIPHPGALIEPGSPVLSIFCTGLSGEECRRRLQSAAEQLDRLWGGSV